MKKILCLIISLSSFRAIAGDFSTIVLNGWTKEEISRDHLRFSNAQKRNYTLHLQVDSYNKDDSWNENTLDDDVKKMESTRKTMSSFLGFKNYQIQSYQYKNMTLEISGSYSRLNKQLIYFKEINFYHREHFLQFKILSEDTPPNEYEIEKLIKEINPGQVEID